MSHRAELLDRWSGTRNHTVVLFGGNPQRRDQVVRHLGNTLDVTIIGTLSQAEGLHLISRLGDDLDLVLIGGQYTPSQRDEIKAALPPQTQVSEPGVDYPYSDNNIATDIATKLDAR